MNFLGTDTQKLDNIAQASVIATRDLESCMSEIGMMAGTHNFVNPWARDSLFATFGTTLYTNVLDAKALKDSAHLAGATCDTKEHDRLVKKVNRCVSF